jgi:predicted transcriptional regulator
MKSKNAVQMLSALAQDARLEIFRMLVGRGPEGMAAGSIAQGLGIPAATLSFHLKEMKNAGIVQYRRDGRSLIYSPDFDAVGSLLAFLTENCCQKTNPS